MNEYLLLTLVIYLVIINVLGLLLMHADKQKSKKGLWRISERTLLGVAIIGGSIGTLVGMNLFHHKTKHARFFIGVPVILVLQIAAALALFLLTR